MEKLIKKHTDKLTVLKNNRAETVDTNTDDVNDFFDKLIQQGAEFLKDLKSIK